MDGHGCTLSTSEADIPLLCGWAQPNHPLDIPSLPLQAGLPHLMMAAAMRLVQPSSGVNGSLR